MMVCNRPKGLCSKWHNPFFVTDNRKEIPMHIHDWSIKKNFCDINKKIEELLRKIELQDEMIRTFGEKYKCLEKSQNNMLKMIVVGELISVISVITLIMMQIF